ncbi:WD40/YVTN repeat-like containing protein [Gracilaria domingensis]|nr:WD40/YVTN repeat-like containing protein [Gracilaria domingensis]
MENGWTVTQACPPSGSNVNIEPELQHTLPHISVVCCVCYDSDGAFLATSSNKCADVFDAQTGQGLGTFRQGISSIPPEIDDCYVRAVCFSPGGNWLITGSDDHAVKVWDVRSRTVKHNLVGHFADVYSVDASANRQFIVSGSGDRHVKLWNLETGSLISTLGGDYGPRDGVISVAFSPSGEHVAAGSLDMTVRVWEVESGRLVRQFEGHKDSVYSVAFSPDGGQILSGSLDKTLKLWDVAAASQLSNKCRYTLSGHQDFVLSATFSPDGRWLISGSKDSTVRFGILGIRECLLLFKITKQILLSALRTAQ